LTRRQAPSRGSHFLNIDALGAKIGIVTADRPEVYVGEELPGGADSMLARFTAGSRIAGYRLEERIGSGGMAVVFRAVDERLGRRVALKAMSPSLATDDAFRRRFIQESRAAAAVDDPHIIPVYEAGESQGILFIAMRFVPGGDVRGLMRREGPLSGTRAAAIISAVASALDSAHAAGLIHRDVKPANMLLDVRPDRPDHVYLSDFGLAKGALLSGMTATGMFLGTLDYSSPEQIESKAVDGRSDQYSLACAAFELLAGSTPFSREQIAAVIWAHMAEPPPALSARRPDLPPAIDQVFTKALSKAPQDRYGSCKEFADALSETLGIVPYRPADVATPGVDDKVRDSVPDDPATDAALIVVPLAVEEGMSTVAAGPGLEPGIASGPEPVTDPGSEPVTDQRPGLVPASRATTPPALDLAGITGFAGGDRPDAESARRPRRLAAATAAALAIAAVAGITTYAAQSFNARHRSTGSTALQPVYGGTLRIVAQHGPDQLDPVQAYYYADYILERGYARQLVSYPTVPHLSINSAGWTADITPVADAATVVPTYSNGGITDGGKVYTFHIRPGVMWNTAQPRQVTAADFVREFKAFCNPVSPVGNSAYYTATIEGLSTYCSEESSYFANNSHSQTAANIAGFQNSHAISGITAVNSLTLRFHLIRRAIDFLYILALPFASARPAEYDSYVPGSPQLEQHLLSDGPYQISSYTPRASVVMTRNPAWRQSTDRIRHQFVKQITVDINGSSASAQVSDLQSGSYDLALDTSAPWKRIAALRASNNPKFSTSPEGFRSYLVFNLRSPDAGGAMGQLAVRRAIEFAVNKAAVQRIEGGPIAAVIADSAVLPGDAGYENYDLYPSPGNAGNVTKCRALLAQAGYSNGFSAIYMYDNNSTNTALFQAIRANLSRCGIQLTGKPESASTFIIDLGKTSASARHGSWDIAASEWAPDWFGNNGRSTIAELFHSSCYLYTINFGCYSNPEMDNLIARAEAAPTVAAAGRLWHQADKLAMQDAVIVPLLNFLEPLYSSARVHSFCAASTSCPTAIVYAPNLIGPDVTNVWLSRH